MTAQATEFHLFQISGPSIKLELKASLASLNISTDVWVKLAQKILTVLTTPVKGVVIWFNHLREEIVVELEKSQARIRKEKLIQVTKIYEEGKREVEDATWLDENGKLKLIGRLDRTLDDHMERIIQFG